MINQKEIPHSQLNSQHTNFCLNFIWKNSIPGFFFKEQSETGSVWLHTLTMGDVSFRKVKELLFDFSYVSGIFFKTAWNFFFILVWKKSQLFFVLKNVPSQLTRFSGRSYTPVIRKNMSMVGGLLIS